MTKRDHILLTMLAKNDAKLTQQLLLISDADRTRILRRFGAALQDIQKFRKILRRNNA